MKSTLRAFDHNLGSSCTGICSMSITLTIVVFVSMPSSTFLVVGPYCCNNYQVNIDVIRKPMKLTVKGFQGFHGEGCASRLGRRL